MTEVLQPEPFLSQARDLLRYRRLGHHVSKEFFQNERTNFTIDQRRLFDEYVAYQLSLGNASAAISQRLLDEVGRRVLKMKSQPHRGSFQDIMQVAHKKAQFYQTEQEIHDFIFHPALTNVMHAFGYGVDETSLQLQEVLNARKSFANQNWDFRQGRERLQAVSALFTEEQEREIRSSAKSLGMVDAIKPKQTEYGAIIILGAGGKHPLWRTQYAKDSGAKAPLIVSLGSENEFNKSGTGYREYAPNAETEADLMSAAIEKVYKREKEEPKIYSNRQPRKGMEKGLAPSDKWQIRYYEGADSLESKLSKPDIFVLSAPSSDTLRRANTADTYAFLAEVLPEEAQSLLLVTSSNFKLFQHFDAIRMLGLPYGKQIETVGFTTVGTVYDSPQHYLQEINSAINSAVALYAATKEASNAHRTAFFHSRNPILRG